MAQVHILRDLAVIFAGSLLVILVFYRFKLPALPGFIVAGILLGPNALGLNALEAQACGCPVVASGVSGLRSVVRDEVSGYLIDEHDPAAYAERIGRLLENSELAQQMGRRGRLLAQRFSWTRTADRLDELFENVVQRNQALVQASARHE